jgi:arylsulfatase A
MIDHGLAPGEPAQTRRPKDPPVRPSAALLALLASLLTLATSAGTASAEVPRPNIVFILVDDLGWNDLSCFGQTNWQTPRLDEMAREGMRFTDAYAGNTVCAPSRAALLTGNHTGRLYQRGNGKVAFRRDPLDTTIATRLQQLGYATAMVGKSGVACNSDDAALPNDKGFDHFYGLLSHVAAHRQYPRQLVRNGERIELPGNEGKTGTTYASGLFVDDAIHWMEDNRDGPFFLHLALTPPHADLTVPARYMEPFRGRWPEKPHTRGGYYHQPEPKAAFAGMVAFIDESVGRVLDAVERLGIDQNTVVFFASDNGPHYEGGAHPDHFDSNGPFRGGKRNLTEGGLRTPQLVWWPGTVAAGAVSDHVTAFWDFPPTALELAGGEIPVSMDGLSVAPLLTGRPDSQASHEYLYWEFHEQGGKQAVRMGPWKGIRLGVGKNTDAPIALYDLRSDIAEQHDLASEHPEIVARIAEAMDEAHTPSERFRFGRPAEKTD